MAGDGTWVVRPARDDEVEELVDVQHRAFTRVALELGFDPRQMPPVAETADEVVALLADNPGSVLLVAEAPGGRLVGTVRGIPMANESVDIGRLGVDDGWERRGIARALMVALEAAFPAAARFELFTGRDAVGPLRLYDSLGYVVMGEQDYSDNVHLVWLEKCRSGRVDSVAHDR